MHLPTAGYQHRFADLPLPRHARQHPVCMDKCTATSQSSWGDPLCHREARLLCLIKYASDVHLNHSTKLVGWPQVHNAMGYCYMNMEKRRDAVTEYSKATALAPGYLTAWNNLADLYEKENRFKEALPAYEKAFEIDPENEVAKLGVQRLRSRVQRMQGTS